ncbi:hypothetical protein AB9T88_17345, partial [Flavobacterium sp. LBUM151]
MKRIILFLSSFTGFLNSKTGNLKYNSALIVIICLLTSGLAQAQTGQIGGVVITNDGNAGQGVVVKLSETNKSTVTNS